MIRVLRHGVEQVRRRTLEDALTWLLEHQDETVHRATRESGWSLVDEKGAAVNPCQPKMCWVCDFERSDIISML